MWQVYIIESAPHLTGLLTANNDGDLTVRSGAASFTLPVGARTADLILIGDPAPFDVVELIHRIKTQTDAPIVVTAQETVEAILPCLEAGASGYVRRDADEHEILETLYAVRAGHAPFAPQLGTALVERMNELIALRRCRIGQGISATADAANLSTREMEILELVAAGLSNQEIAARLIIEIGTVKNHVHSILKKLGVSNRNQAVLYYTALQQSAATPVPLQ